MIQINTFLNCRQEERIGFKIKQNIYNDDIYKPTRGSFYFKLPTIFADKHTKVNKIKKDDRCFMWSIIVGV